MRMYSVGALCLCVMALYSEDIKPIYSCVYHPGGQDAGKKFTEEFRKQSGGGVNVKFILDSDGVRIGGGRISLSGKHLIESNGCIIGVWVDREIDGPVTTIAGLLKGKYALAYSVEGVKYFVSEMTVGEVDMECPILVRKERAITGVVEGIPSWALASPLIYNDFFCSKISSSGNFSVKTRSLSDDLFVDFFMAPVEGLGVDGNLRYRIKAIKKDGADSVWFIRDLGNTRAISVRGKVVVSEAKKKVGLDRLLMNVEAKILSSDSSVQSFSRIDKELRFVFCGMPPGKYTIRINDSPGNPPLVAAPLSIDVVEGQLTDNVELNVP